MRVKNVNFYGFAGKISKVRQRLNGENAVNGEIKVSGAVFQTLVLNQC